jgi:putative ABC transport system substrate-binding protein
MRRREFITLLGGAVAISPSATRAQHRALPIIGFLNSFDPQVWGVYLAAFQRGLREAGFVEGENVEIDYRWGRGHFDQLPSLAAELVRRPVAVLVASGGDQAALAAKAATETIPIVASIAFDPVDYGIVKSLARPGGNITGVSLFTSALVAKRLEVLRELLPNVSTIAFLVNPTNPAANADRKDIEAAAKSVGQQVVVVEAATETDCEVAFETIARGQAGALTIEADPLYARIREKLVALATRFRVPTIYHWREFMLAGGLISYGSSLTEAYHQLGIYAGRVVNGSLPSELPIVQPTKFELIVNLKVAKTLDIVVPTSILLRADEVIE